MSKRSANKGKKRNASVRVDGSKQRTAQGRTYNQIRPDQKTRRQRNKRIEFVLNPAYDEDRKMIALLDDLQGGKSDYIREALALKMEHDQHPLHDMMEDMIRAAAILGAMLKEVPTVPYFDSAINAVLDRFDALTLETVTATRVSVTPAVVQSSGLDMSRPRPRAAPRQQAQIAAGDDEELTEQQKVQLAQIMARSIRNAQPGRG